AGPNGPWLVGDTYPLDENGNYDDFGNQYLFLFHMPTKTYIPLVKKRSRAVAGLGPYRVDYHNRVSRDGRMVSFDSSHAGMGRQLYTVAIGSILDSPPGGGPGNAPPAVSFASPGNGDVFPVGSNVRVTVNASDPDDGVARVELYLNGQYVRTEFNPPYEWGD